MILPILFVTALLIIVAFAFDGGILELEDEVDKKKREQQAKIKALTGKDQ